MSALSHAALPTEGSCLDKQERGGRKSGVGCLAISCVCGDINWSSRPTQEERNL